MSKYILRIYNGLFVPFLAITGILVLRSSEIGNHPLLPVDVVLGFAMIFAALLELLAVIIDKESWYNLAFTLTTISLSAWSFTICIYAIYGMVEWTRVVVFAYVLWNNAFMQPYLINERIVQNILLEHGTVPPDEHH